MPRETAKLQWGRALASFPGSPMCKQKYCKRQKAGQWHGNEASCIAQCKMLLFRAKTVVKESARFELAHLKKEEEEA